MTRTEKNELLVKFACARLAGRAALHVDEDAIEDIWSVADAMLAGYIKRQPQPTPQPPAPVISDAEWERGNEVLEKFKKELNDFGTRGATIATGAGSSPA